MFHRRQSINSNAKKPAAKGFITKHYTQIKSGYQTMGVNLYLMLLPLLGFVRPCFADSNDMFSGMDVSKLKATFSSNSMIIGLVIAITGTTAAIAAALTQDPKRVANAVLIALLIQGFVAAIWKFSGI